IMLFMISFTATKKLLIFCRIYTSSFFILLLCFFSGILVDVFGIQYSYQNAPSPIKDQIELFIKEANFRGVDISRIKQLKITYLPWKYSPTFYAGFCDVEENKIKIPQRDID